MYELTITFAEDGKEPIQHTFRSLDSMAELYPHLAAFMGDSVCYLKMCVRETEMWEVRKN